MHLSGVESATAPAKYDGIFFEYTNISIVTIHLSKAFNTVDNKILLTDILEPQIMYHRKKAQEPQSGHRASHGGQRPSDCLEILSGRC